MIFYDGCSTSMLVYRRVSPFLQRWLYGTCTIYPWLICFIPRNIKNWLQLRVAMIRCSIPLLYHQLSQPKKGQNVELFLLLPIFWQHFLNQLMGSPISSSSSSSKSCLRSFSLGWFDSRGANWKSIFPRDWMVLNDLKGMMVWSSGFHDWIQPSVVAAFRDEKRMGAWFSYFKHGKLLKFGQGSCKLCHL